MQRYADRLAKYFLPVVLGLALLTFIGNVFFLMNATMPPGVPRPRR